MKLIRLSGFVLVAVFSVCAVLASAASAGLPLFLPSTKQKFDSTSGLAVLVSGAGEVIHCESDTNTGEITGSETVGHLVVVFHGCTVVKKVGETPCTIKSTNQSSEGLIVTNTLAGHLGTSKEATNGVALLLEPETTKKFTTFAETTCSPESAVNGSVAGEVVTTSKGAAHTGKINFEAASVGSSAAKITKVNGKLVELEAFGKEASEETADTILFLTVNVEVC